MKNLPSLNRQIFVLLAGTFLFRILLNEILFSAGLPSLGLFAPNSDIFADSIKQCLAELPITAPLFGAHRVATWPLLFQQYLYHNPYLSPMISVYAQPPLADLQLMAVAKTIVLSNPFDALWLQFGLYVFLTYVVKLIIDAALGASRSTWLLWGAMLLCYPSVYMLDRGNYHSGYASLGAIFYILTRFTGQLRWLGIAGLSIAINLRPNIVILSLLEFALIPGFGAALKSEIILGLCTLSVWCIALIMAHAIDVHYSMRAFFTAYGVFQNSYIFNDAGLYSVSLYGGVRAIWHFFGATPSYNPVAASVISDLGIISVALFLGLAIRGKLTKIEAIFLVSALCMLFTPFNAEYHMLKFAAPLLVVAVDVQRRGAAVNLLQIWPALAEIFLFGVIASLYPCGLTALLLVAGTALALVQCWQWASRMGEIARTEALILVVSGLVLCPLGEGLPTQIAISVLLCGACGIIFTQAQTKPA
jgi:hypothetical protein